MHPTHRIRSRRFAWKTLLAAGASLLVLQAAPGLAACLGSGTDATIQAALSGPNAIAELCPNAVFNIFNTVFITGHGQQIRTQGLPSGASRATLQAASSSVTTLIHARDFDNVTIRNIKINGKRPVYGYVAGAQAMVMLGGNASNQRFERVRAWNTRTWSTVQAFEGPSFARCNGAVIVNNDIGPAGTDTPNKWADGISLACPNSLVSGNTITNATDGAIVVFGAPGSTVEFNTIVQTGPTLLGGINMVDYIPFNGDYTGTVVRNNTIQASGGYIKVGIAMGPRVWFCPGTGIPATGPTGTVFGGTVQNNTLLGNPMGYGYVADGVTGWTVTGNTSSATHVGKPGLTCEADQKNAGPHSFRRHPTHAQGTFQSQFQTGVTHAVLSVFLPF